MTRHNRDDNIYLCLERIVGMCNELRREVHVLSSEGARHEVCQAMLWRCYDIESAIKTTESIRGKEK